MTLFLLGLLKFLIGLVGIFTSFVFLVLWVIKRTRRNKLRNAALTFLVTFILIIAISVLEFLRYPSNSKLNQLVLSAYREAPLGAFWLGVYDDLTWELGNSSREIEIRGTYTISGDTLYLTTSKGMVFYNGNAQNVFVISGDNLIEVENSGIRGLEISLNKLTEIN
jgi:hypothetical protein